MFNARRRRHMAGWGAFFALAAIQVAPALAMGVPRLKPPPPGPAFASPADLDRLRDVRDAVERRSWSGAKAAADMIADPAAKSLAQWFYYYAEDPKVDFLEADRFMDGHPDWPALSKIQTHAEKNIPDDASPESILEFFKTRDPLTGPGLVMLARAEIETGMREAGELQLRDAWVNHDFTVSDEQEFLARYASKLRPEDHAARVDRLLWAREVTAARRVFPRLSAKDRRLAEARAALLMRAASAPALFEALPDDERMDSGALLAAVRYYRRAEEEPRAIMLARQAPLSPDALRNPERWWEERQLLMRWALTEKQYNDAYAMASAHGLNPGTEFAEAEFNAGWIALRFLNAPERAETHFKALAGAVSAPISVARAWYWLGRAAEARGQRDIAAARYARAASNVYTFYGQLAAERIGAPANAQTFAAPITPTAEERARFASRPVVAALRILADLGADREFLTFAYQADDQLESAGEYVELANLASRIGATHVAVRAGKVGIGRGAFAAEVAYPVVYVPEEAAKFAPPEVILGLSRQESEFNPRAYSSAGARGLMQLIPSTAQITARKARLRYNRAALLDDPVYNMIIGSAHLAHLFEDYGESRILTYVAYNAGPNRAAQWIERYGDPRSSDVDPVDWIEQIPFAETRNYVQRVLENTQVYRARLNNAPIAGRLAADLELGGPAKRAGLMPAAQFASALPPLPERTAKFASAAPADDAGVHLAPAQPQADLGGAGPVGDATALRQEISLEAGRLTGAEEAGLVGEAAAAAAPAPSRKPAASKIVKQLPARAELPPGAPAPDDNSAAALNAFSVIRTVGSDEPPAVPQDILEIGDGVGASGAPAGAPVVAADADADRCAYVAFLREQVKTAEDPGPLNAALLAETQGGGAGC